MLTFVIIVGSVACAEIDITNMTFDELLEARELITQAIGPLMNGKR